MTRPVLALPGSLQVDKGYGVIEKDDVLALLLEACPSFGDAWARYQSAPGHEQGLLYIDLGEFAHHVWKS